MTTLKCPAGYIFVLVQFEDPVLIKSITKFCYSQFLFQFWNLYFSIVYLTSLQTFFCAHRVCKQFILSFKALQTFFSIFPIPPPEIKWSVPKDNYTHKVLLVSRLRRQKQNFFALFIAMNSITIARYSSTASWRQRFLFK